MVEKCEHSWLDTVAGKQACRKCGEVRNVQWQGNEPGASQKPTRRRCRKCGRKIRGTNHEEHCN